MGFKGQAKGTGSHTGRELNWFLTLGIALVTLICAALAATSLVLTASPSLAPLSEHVTIWHLFAPGRILMTCLALLAGVAYAALAVLVARKSSSIPERGFVAALGAAAMAFCIVWIAMNATEHNGFSDSAQILAYARQVARGDTSSFLPHSDSFAGKLPGDMYLSNYPFQSGILLLMEGFCRLFGTWDVQAFQLACALCCVGTSLVLVDTARACGRPKAERLLVAFLSLTLFAPLVFVVFPYGNTIGLFFALLAMDLWLRSREQTGTRRRLYVLTGSLALAFGLAVKSTYVVVAIGFLLVLLIDCLRKRDAWAPAAFVVLLVVASQASGIIPQRIMEARLGYELPANQPKTAWIAMGLSDDSVLGADMPGWWSTSALDSQVASEGDVEAMERNAEDSITASLATFGGDPGYAAWFFGKKLATEWLDPTFQSLYIAGCGTMRPEAQARTNASDGRFDPADASLPQGILGRALECVMDGQQSVVYLGATAGGLALLGEVRRRRANTLELALPCAFFMGFVVYTLWEAKGMYALPFFLCLLPLAARGIALMAQGHAADKA